MTIDSAALSPEEIRRRVSDYEWYHTIDLGPRHRHARPVRPGAKSSSTTACPRRSTGDRCSTSGPGSRVLCLRVRAARCEGRDGRSCRIGSSTMRARRCATFRQQGPGISRRIPSRRIGLCDPGSRIAHRTPLLQRLRPDAGACRCVRSGVLRQRAPASHRSRSRALLRPAARLPRRSDHLHRHRHAPARHEPGARAVSSGRRRARRSGFRP